MKSILVLACALSLALASQNPTYRVNDDAPVAAEPLAAQEGGSAIVEPQKARTGKYYDGGYYAYAQSRNSAQNIHPAYTPLVYNYYQRPSYYAGPQAFRFAAPRPYAAAYPYVQFQPQYFPVQPHFAQAQPQYAQQVAFIQPSTSNVEAGAVQDTPAIKEKQAFTPDVDSMTQGEPEGTPQERFLFNTGSYSGTNYFIASTTSTSSYGSNSYGSLCFFGACFG